MLQSLRSVTVLAAMFGQSVCRSTWANADELKKQATAVDRIKGKRCGKERSASVIMADNDARPPAAALDPPLTPVGLAGAGLLSVQYAP
jgi:hypothetical protein